MTRWLPWVLVVIAGAAALFLYQRGQAQARAATEAGRQVEAKLLKEHDALVAETSESTAMLRGLNDELTAEVARLKAIAPTVKVVRVVEIKTVVQPALVPVELGDSLFAKVSEVGVRTELGHEAAVGRVSVYKAPSELVFSARFDEKASRLSVDPVAQCPPPPSCFQAVAISCAACGVAATGATLYLRR